MEDRDMLHFLCIVRFIIHNVYLYVTFGRNDDPRGKAFQVKKGMKVGIEWEKRSRENSDNRRSVGGWVATIKTWRKQEKTIQASRVYIVSPEDK